MALTGLILKTLFKKYEKVYITKNGLNKNIKKNNHARTNIITINETVQDNSCAINKEECYNPIRKRKHKKNFRITNLRLAY